MFCILLCFLGLFGVILDELVIADQDVGLESMYFVSSVLLIELYVLGVYCVFFCGSNSRTSAYCAVFRVCLDWLTMAGITVFCCIVCTVALVIAHSSSRTKCILVLYCGCSHGVPRKSRTVHKQGRKREDRHITLEHP